METKQIKTTITYSVKAPLCKLGEVQRYRVCEYNGKKHFGTKEEAIKALYAIRKREPKYPIASYKEARVFEDIREYEEIIITRTTNKTSRAL